jgi:hypothetical protein
MQYFVKFKDGQPKEEYRSMPEIKGDFLEVYVDSNTRHYIPISRIDRITSFVNS